VCEGGHAVPHEGAPAGRYRIRTADAFSNEPMLAINNALGFKVV
jgi:hypothetical protein